MEQPRMHCHDELLEDLIYEDFLPDNIMLKWFNDSYSTSKHTLTLYSIIRGLKARNVLEIGFGRSSFVIARATGENEGNFITCDINDFSYLLNEKEKSVTTFIHGKSDNVWPILDKQGIEFAFLDYFSSEHLSIYFVANEIQKCLKYLKTNGILAIHDSIISKYKIQRALRLLQFIPNNLEVLSLPYNYGLGLIRKTGKSKYGTNKDEFLKKEE